MTGGWVLVKSIISAAVVLRRGAVRGSGEPGHARRQRLGVATCGPGGMIQKNSINSSVTTQASRSRRASFELDPRVETGQVVPDQLGQISTHWSVLVAACSGTKEAHDAMTEFVMRYRPAILRYLQSRLPSQDAVHDVCQEFMIQFLDKKIGMKKPRGPFRYYIKGILDNLIADYHRKHRRWKQRRGSSEALHSVGVRDDQLEDRFTREWKKQLLETAWARFKQAETARGPTIYYLALKLRQRYPKARSNELAAKLSELVGRSINETYFRKVLERARMKLFRFVLDEVRRSLPEGAEDRVEEELRELGLYSLYERCEKAATGKA